jgi:DNA polymerase-3 subunit beta
MTQVCEAISRRDLAAALSICGRVVPRRALAEVYQSVSLAAGAAEATDGELRVSVPIPYDGEPILLPFARLEALTRACTGEQLEIDSEDGQATIRAGGGRWRLPTVAHSEWPEVAESTAVPVARIPGDQLRRALDAVLDAADSESSRYALAGVRLEVEDGVVHVVATDGRRLHVCEVEIDQAVDDCQLLIPVRAAGLIATLCRQTEEEVQLERSGEEVRATWGESGLWLRCRQLAGNYPAWRAAIPERPEATRVVVRADHLAQALRQAAICTSETSKAITLTIGEVITATAESSEAGASTVTLEAIEATGSVSVKVDPGYCVAWLRTCDQVEPITVEASDSGSALVFRSEDATGVVMPMGDD